MHASVRRGIPLHTETYMRVVLLGPPGSGRRILAKKLARQFGIGAGYARFTIDGDIDADGWKGSLTDSYQALLVFGAVYF